MAVSAPALAASRLLVLETTANVPSLVTTGRCRCSYWTCAAAWCCLEMPCCIGAVLRRRLYVALGYDPPSFATACLWYHCLCAPCSICQEARLVAAKTRNIELKGAVERMER